MTSSSENTAEGMREFSIPLRKSYIPAALEKCFKSTKSSPFLASVTPTPNRIKMKKVHLAVPIFTPRQIATPIKPKKNKIKKLAGWEQGVVRGEETSAMPSPDKYQTSLGNSSQYISEVRSISGNTPVQATPILPPVTSRSLLEVVVEDGKKNERNGEELSEGWKEEERKEKIDKKLEVRKDKMEMKQEERKERVEKLEERKVEGMGKLEGRKEERMEKKLEGRKVGKMEKLEGKKEEKKLEGRKEEGIEKFKGWKEERMAKKLEERKDERVEKLEGRKVEKIEKLEERREEGMEKKLEERKEERMDKLEGRVEENEGGVMAEKGEKEEERCGEATVKPKQSRTIQPGFVALSEQTTSTAVLHSKSVAMLTEREADLYPTLSSDSPTNPHLDSMQLTPSSFKQKVAMVSPLPHSSSASSKPIARVKPNLHLSPVDSGSKNSDIHPTHSGTQIRGTPTPSPHFGLGLPRVISNKSHDISEEKIGESGRRLSSSDGYTQGWKVTNSTPISENKKNPSSSRSAKKRKKKRKHKHHSYLPSSGSSGSDAEQVSENRHQQRDHGKWESGRKRSRRDYSSDDEDDDRRRQLRSVGVKYRHTKKHKKAHKKHREEKRRGREKDRKKHRHSNSSYIRSSDSGSERVGHCYRVLWKHSEKKREHFVHHRHRSPSPWSDEDRKRERWRGERSKSPADRKKMRLDSSSRTEGKTKKLKPGLCVCL